MILLLRAFLKFVTGSTPLNKGEQDQPPSDGVTFQKDHVDDAWAWDRNGRRVFKRNAETEGLDEVESAQNEGKE